MKKNQLTLQDLKTIMRKRVPGQVIIQLTDRCNALCPQCGMRKTNDYQRSDLSIDEVKHTIEAAAVKGVSAVSFTGGEPFLRLNDLVELIRHAGDCGIRYIRTGTNGFIFMKPEKKGFERRIHDLAEQLSRTRLRNLWISIDSFVPEVHEDMRGLPGVIRGIEKALPILHNHGIYPSANLGVNRYIAGYPQNPDPSGSGIDKTGDEEAASLRFANAFRRFYGFATDLGFTMVSTCYPMSIDENQGSTLSAVYGASSADSVVNFGKEEKACIYRSLCEVIPEFRSRIRIFTPQSSLHALYRQYTSHPERACPCRGGVDFFFIDSRDGNTYPCGYRGKENLGKFTELDLRTIDTRCRCTACDWECFRDPSELFGPALEALSGPSTVIKRFRKDPAYFRYWRNDLMYYRACDFFDGRKPPALERMRKFAPVSPRAIGSKKSFV